MDGVIDRWMEYWMDGWMDEECIDGMWINIGLDERSDGGVPIV